MDRGGARDRGDDRPKFPQGPAIPEGITGSELPKEIRSQLRPLSKDNAELVAKHLVAASELIGVDPEAAFAHAQTAAVRGSRVAGVREAAGIVAYHADRYEEALRELRTHRRISGSDDNLPLIADAERGRGRPQKALEVFSEASEEALGHVLYTELLMVAAGAHMDRGEVAEARALLETRNFAGNANGTLVRLLSVYSDVIRLQGDADLAGRYEELARRTAKATGTLFGDEDPDLNANVEIVTLEELELPDDEAEPEAEAEAAVETADEEGAFEDRSAESSADEVPGESLRAVDAEFASETVDELEEILDGAEAPTPESESSENESEAPAQEDVLDTPDTSEAPAAPEAPEPPEAKSTESAKKESVKKESKPKEPEHESAPDDYEELTEPLFDL